MLKAVYYEEAYLIGDEVFVRNPHTRNLVRVTSPEPITKEEQRAISNCQTRQIESRGRKKVQQLRKIKEIKELLSELEKEL